MSLLEGSLFNKSPFQLVMGFALMPFCIWATDTSVTVWAEETIPLDISSDECRLAVRDVKVWHNPDWCTDGTNVQGAVAVLKAVANPDTENAVTSTVSIVDADSLSSIVWSESGYTRFLMSAQLDGVTIGNTLVKDISCGEVSTYSTELAFDVRTNRLQEIVNAESTTNIWYDLTWVNVASNADISLVRTKRTKGGSVLEVSTNVLYTVDTPITGEVEFVTKDMPRGDYVLMLREYSADGNLLLETYSPEFSIVKAYGTCFIVR
jgi:hypothetical protein